MSEHGDKSVDTQLAVLAEKLDSFEGNLVRRVAFLESICFGFVGLIVLGVLTTLGGLVVWGLSFWGSHKGQ